MSNIAVVTTFSAFFAFVCATAVNDRHMDDHLDAGHILTVIKPARDALGPAYKTQNPGKTTVSRLGVINYNEKMIKDDQSSVCQISARGFYIFGTVHGISVRKPSCAPQ